MIPPDLQNKPFLVHVDERPFVARLTEVDGALVLRAKAYRPVENEPNVFEWPARIEGGQIVIDASVANGMRQTATVIRQA